MDKSLLEAVKLLGQHTNGRFDVWFLMGNRNARIRSEIMSVLMGKKIPQAKSGVTAIRAELYKRSRIDQIENICEATRSEHFRDWCKKQNPES